MFFFKISTMTRYWLLIKWKLFKALYAAHFVVLDVLSLMVPCSDNTSIIVADRELIKYSDGVSMHLFPKDEATRKLWVLFVRKHRPNFVPSESSALWTMHFEATCYTRLSGVTFSDYSSKEKRILQKGSVPTKDIAATDNATNTSQRERRKVSPPLYAAWSAENILIKM